MLGNRLAAAFAALLGGALLLAACGGTNPAVEEPLVKEFVRELARALVQNEKDRIASYILPNAGQGNNPIGAQEWDNPEGREKIKEGNRRQLRKTLLDAGIMSEEQLKTGVVDEAKIDRLIQALRVHVDGVNAIGRFDIAGGPGRLPEVVTWKFIKTDQQLWHY